jgi:hypothetical protein
MDLNTEEIVALLQELEAFRINTLMGLKRLRELEDFLKNKLTATQQQ